MIGPALAVLAVVEIIVYVVVAHATSWGLVILLTLLTSAAGLVLAPRLAARAFRDARASRSGSPAAGLADAAVAVAGCALLVVPGFVSDVLGLLMVLGPTRAVIRRLVGRRIAARFVRSRVVTTWPSRGSATGARHPGGPGTPGHDVIEGEVLPPDSTTPRRPD